MTYNTFRRFAAVSGLVALTWFPGSAAATVFEVASALRSAYEVYDRFAGGSLTLEQATDQILDAIATAEREILDRVDQLAASQGKACARSSVILARDLDTQTPVETSLLAHDALACLSLVEDLLSTVESKTAVDGLGFALNALGPVTVLALANADREELIEDVFDLLLSGNRTVVVKLRPSCHSTLLRGDSAGQIMEGVVRCHAYNGDSGIADFLISTRRRLPSTVSERVAKRKAEEQAAKDTSRPIAEEILEIL